MSFLWRHFEAEDGHKNFGNKHFRFQQVKLLKKNPVTNFD